MPIQAFVWQQFPQDLSRKLKL